MNRKQPYQSYTNFVDQFNALYIPTSHTSQV